MKTLILTLVFALMLMSGSALKCKNCIAPSGGRCRTTTETCGIRQDACISAIYRNYPFGHFKRCIAMSGCRLLQVTQGIRATCCQRDLCN